MAHEIAKLILEHADSFVGRTGAIKTALRLGMKLNEIEEYLDWLEVMDRPQINDHRDSDDPPAE